MAVNGVSDIFSELLSIIEIGNRLNRELKPGSKQLPVSGFKNFSVPFEINVPTASVGQPQCALQWTVPQNMAFLCTFIAIKTLQPQIGAGTLPNAYPDDMSGLLLSQAWLTQDGVGNPISKPNAIYLGIANKPVCFLFNAGKTVNLLVEITPTITSVAGVAVASSLNGWLGGSDLLQVFQQFQTLVGNTTGYPGGSGGGTNVAGPTIPSNVPF